MDDFKRQLVEQIPVLMRFATALTGNASTAEDLLQDCLERTLNRGHLWDQSRSLKTWLFTIMRNIYIDQYRRNANAPTLEPIYPDSDIHGIPPSHDEYLATHELNIALARLPVEQREVILLVGLEGLGYKEVSDILDVPVGTIMSRLHRARQQLRQVLFSDQQDSLQPADLGEVE